MVYKLFPVFRGRLQGHCLDSFDQLGFRSKIVINPYESLLEPFNSLFKTAYKPTSTTTYVYEYVEKYFRTPSYTLIDGLYCYNFGLNSDPFTYQPSGAINLSKFKRIELEINTHVPNIDGISSVYDTNVYCNDNGDAVGIKKDSWRLYEYNYNLVLYEERYNVLSFLGGNCGLLYSR